MPDRFTVQHREIGMLRIFMKPSDRIGERSIRTLWGSKPLYRELIRTAKADGIINAVAQHMHYGFSNHGPIRENGSESADPYMTICVELVGDREQLDLFCRRQGNLLGDKVIVYKQLEHWSVIPKHQIAERSANLSVGVKTDCS
jgi:PII-like signaling protein